jgi:FkbM family methyltransferase
VYAFEPVKRVYNKLAYNNKINDFNIHCIDKAISNEDGFADLYDLDEEHEYSASLNSDSGLMVAHKTTKVETITLDRFVEDNNIKQIDLIKIDVETFEAQVFEGFQKYLRLYQPSIIVEILSNEIGDKVKAWTNGMGYLYFNINEKEGLSQVDRLEKRDDYNYLICTQAKAKSLELL